MGPNRSERHGGYRTYALNQNSVLPGMMIKDPIMHSADLQRGVTTLAKLVSVLGGRRWATPPLPIEKDG